MKQKTYEAVLIGKSDRSINFLDFRNLIVDLGFAFQRQDGSHRIYRHPTHRIKMNIQPDGNKAKSYQVKQLRNFIIKYGL